MLKTTVFILTCVLFFACGSESSSTSLADCPNKPQAFFSKEIPLIGEHSFELRSDLAYETAKFKDGTFLEIYQTGCEKVQQEFRWTIKGDFENKSGDFWRKRAVELLMNISNLGAKYQSIALWAKTIVDNEILMKLGKSVEVEQGRFVMVDKIVTTGEAVVIVKIGQGQ